MLLEFRAAGYSGYAVKFSPFNDSRVAMACAKNFGLVGNGALVVTQLTPDGILAEHVWETQDALYDVAHSEANEDQMVVACGDGTVMLYDVKQPAGPVVTWKEHGREVYSVAFNHRSKGTFISSSWDGTIKMWDHQRQDSMLTLPTHSCTYSAAFSPHNPSVISSVTSDSHLRIFDTRTPASASNHLMQLIPIHGSAPTHGSSYSGNQPVMSPPSEALTHDWNKYRQNIVAVAGVDTLIRVFDTRNPRQPVSIMAGHEYAVRRIAYSPHHTDVLLSASYDMSIRVWGDGTLDADMGIFVPGGGPASGRQMGRFDVHTEFCAGVDWCLFGNQGWVASTAWDGRLCVWDIGSVMARR